MKQTEHFLSILRNLISIYSPTFNEEQISEYIASTYFNPDLWEVRIDDMHNIMASPKGNTKNDLPLLVAHLDTHPAYTNPEDIPRLKSAAELLRVEEGNDWLIRPGEPLQLGLDDKCGIAMILVLVSEYHTTPKSFKVLLTTVEEKGRRGVQHALENSPDFFRETPWSITLDRHGGTDIISEYRGLRLAPDTMLENIAKISRVAGYPMIPCPSPRMADSYNIACETAIPIVNLSIGCYDEHSTHDRLNVREALCVLNVVQICLASGNLVNGV
ncbi:MAG: hypothetical protein STSR0009_20090 [Methanoregula sp.]